jgi:hypothetical protein
MGKFVSFHWLSLFHFCLIFIPSENAPPMKIDQASFIVDSLPPTVHVVVPPALKADIMALAAENIHPAWAKAHARGRHFVIVTNSLEDISEIADYARVGIEEPEPGLSKRKRQAFQILLDRANRHAELEPMGHCHCIATKWRRFPLKSTKIASRTMKELQDKRAFCNEL